MDRNAFVNFKDRFYQNILGRLRLWLMTYCRVHNSSDGVFFKILKKPSLVQKWMILYMSGILVFIEMKLKKNFFFEKKKIKIKMANFKKLISSSANSQYFFMKMSLIGSWVCRIDWCKGHWCGLPYMVVRLSNRS